MADRYCPYCGCDYVPEEDDDCPECGSYVPRVCPKCGTELEKFDDGVCPTCRTVVYDPYGVYAPGSTIRKDGTVAVATEQPRAEVQAEPPREETPAEQAQTPPPAISMRVLWRWVFVLFIILVIIRHFV